MKQTLARIIVVAALCALAFALLIQVMHNRRLIQLTNQRMAEMYDELRTDTQSCNPCDSESFVIIDDQTYRTVK